VWEADKVLPITVRRIRLKHRLKIDPRQTRWPMIPGRFNSSPTGNAPRDTLEMDLCSAQAGQHPDYPRAIGPHNRVPSHSQFTKSPCGKDQPEGGSP
jgi:hypothetical protein